MQYYAALAAPLLALAETTGLLLTADPTSAGTLSIFAYRP